jgi:thiol-disulfide isomerase/thioredoxin
MVIRTTVMAAALVALVWAAAQPSLALERKVYDPAALASDQASGKSILVHVTAPWCPTCKAQKPILDKLTAEPDLKDFVVYDLDFDTGIAGLKALNARSQSTIIVFKGEKETGRSVGDTNAESISTLLKTAL